MTLRPMAFDDADFLLEMKNYTETRRFAIISKEEIKKEDHYKWLESNIQYFKIIYISPEESFGLFNDWGGASGRAGAVRIQDNEISIWVNRYFRRMGIATKTIEMVSTKGMIAKIIEGNLPSMRAFISAGFKPISYQDGYYIFQK